MTKQKRTAPTWVVASFILGATLSGAVSAAYSRIAVPAASTKRDVQAVQSGNLARIFLPPVTSDEIDAAIDSLPMKERQSVRAGVESGKYQLLWLTIWDWDTVKGEAGNTISITSDRFRRIVTLDGHRTRTVVPRPKSGHLEFRGEASEDGTINVSILSGTQPVALPAMPPGQIAKVEIWQ